MLLYAVALRFTFTGTKGPSPNNENQTQTINSYSTTNLYSWHYTVGQVVFCFS